MFFSFCLWMFSSPSIIYLEINNALLFLYSVDFVFWKKSIVHTYHDPDNHDGVITHLEPDILECEVKCSQASSCLRKGTPLASRVARGVSGPSSSCVWNPRVFADDARGWQCPFVLCLHPHYLRIGVWASRSYQEQIAKSRSFGMWHHHRGYVSNFLMRQPHLRCVEKVGNPLQTKQGN